MIRRGRPRAAPRLREPCQLNLSTPARRTSLVERLRAVHLQMLDAVLAGDGLAA